MQQKVFMTIFWAAVSLAALRGCMAFWSTTTSALDIPGNTRLRHCNSDYDPYDPDDELSTISELTITPNPPILRVSIPIVFLTFDANEMVVVIMPGSEHLAPSTPTSPRHLMLLFSYSQR